MHQDFAHRNSALRMLRGLSIIEVMVALVILGVISVIYMQTTRYAQKNAGKGIDWQAESVVIEKTIENLRVGYTVAQIQALNTSSIDSTQGKLRISVKVKGGVPPASIATSFSSDKLAQVTVTAKRDTFNDSIVVTTYLWIN